MKTQHPREPLYPLGSLTVLWFPAAPKEKSILSPTWDRQLGTALTGETDPCSPLVSPGSPLHLSYSFLTSVRGYASLPSGTGRKGWEGRNWGSHSHACKQPWFLPKP